MAVVNNSLNPHELHVRPWRRWREEVIRLVLLACGLLSVLVTFGIVFVLLSESLGFFTHVSPLSFLGGVKWAPLFEPRHFGVLPLVCGSLLVMIGAAFVALPTGVLTAIYLSEYASQRARSIIKPILEILAGIPTVVYGYFALTFITPLLRTVFPGTEIFNAASASIVVGIMVLPMVASLCDDAFRAVPNALRQGGFAMGATKHEVAMQVVLPAALSGVLASFILALSRAVGETMATTIAAGATPRLTANPLQSIQTMSAYIVQVSLGDTPHGTVEYQTLFAVGLVLFSITLLMNIIAHKVLRRFQEVYE